MTVMIPDPPVANPSTPPQAQSTDFPSDQIITPPIRKKPPLLKLVIVAAVGLLVLLIITAIITQLRSNRGGLAALTPTPTPNQSSSSSDSSQITPTPLEAKRLALTELEGHKLIVSSQSSLWTISFTVEGPRRSQLFTAKNKIIDLSLSPTGKLLALVTASDSARLNTGLTVLNLDDASFTDLVTPEEAKSISDPVWSSDGLYLAVWNQGKSTTLFDMTTKRRLLDITPSSSSPIGHIVFVPNQAKISYVDAGNLIESEYSGDKKTQVTDGLNPVRTSPDGTAIPDLHLYSPNTTPIAFHNQLGQLVLFDRKDSSRQILAESNSGNPLGYALFFDPDANLVYFSLTKDVYAPGVDDNPLKVYVRSKKSAQPFFSYPKTPVDLRSLIPDPLKRKAVAHNQGYTVVSSLGQIQANCDHVTFTYAFTSPSRVWSTDSKYLLSLSDNQIADSTSCSITAPFDPQKFDLAVWLK